VAFVASVAFRASDHLGARGANGGETESAGKPGKPPGSTRPTKERSNHSRSTSGVASNSSLSRAAPHTTQLSDEQLQRASNEPRY
jgi:hypothetical protein